MPIKSASPEMITFASQFGGVIEFNHQDFPEGDPFIDRAINTAQMYLDDFSGTWNGYEELFAYDLQVFDNLTPNAVCGLEGNVYCVGINAGLVCRITDIAVALISHNHLGMSWVGATRSGNFETPENIFDGEEANELSDRFRRINEAGLWSLLLYTTNMIALFVLLHEIHHAADGHVSYMIRSRSQQQLSEMSASSSTRSPEDVQILLELEADSNAFFTIVGSLLQGQLFFSASDKVFDQSECFELFWVGVLMLMNTWASGEYGAFRSTSHPASLDRIINIFNLPTRLSSMYPEKQSLVQASELKVAKCLISLQRSDPAYLRLIVPLVEESVDRYLDLVRRYSRPDLKDAQQRVEICSFQPKSLPTMRDGQDPLPGLTI